MNADAVHARAEAAERREGELFSALVIVRDEVPSIKEWLFELGATSTGIEVSFAKIDAALAVLEGQA